MPNVPSGLPRENISLFTGLTRTEYERIVSGLAPWLRSYEKGDIVIHQGEEVRDVGILLEGGVLHEKYHIDGESQVVREFHPGDMIALEAVTSRLSTSPGAFVAAKDSVICWIPYRRMMQDGALPLRIQKTILENTLAAMADENIRYEYKIDALSKRSLRERIKRHLSVISEKRQNVTVDIGMNQEQFANYLCVDRSSLSAELNKMRREGLISYRKSVYTIHFYPIG